MTLASEPKRKTPGRSGANQPKFGRGSASEALPPTLLRLPDLDLTSVPAAEATSAAAEESPRAAESPSTAKPQASVATSAAGQTAPAEQTARAEQTAPAEQTVSSIQSEWIQRDAAYAAARVALAAEQDRQSSAMPHPAEFSSSNHSSSNHSSSPIDLQPPTSKHRTASDWAEITSGPEESSWLSHFASRKTLLVLLLLIGGLAVFLPRSAETIPQELTSQVASTESDAGMETLLAQTSEPASGELSMPPHSRVEPVSEFHQHTVAAVDSIAPRTTMRSENRNTEIVPPFTPSMIQQPTGDALAGGLPSFDQLASLAKANQDNSVAPLVFSQRPATETPQFDPASLDAATADWAAEANEEIRRMDAAQNSGRAVSLSAPQTDFNSSAAGSSFSQPVAAPGKPVLVESATPKSITNWADYLPPLDAESFALGVAIDASVAAQSGGVATRATSLPVAPDFRFALPDGDTTSAPVGPASSDPVTSPAGGVKIEPEARVAMPGMLGRGAVTR